MSAPFLKGALFMLNLSNKSIAELIDPKGFDCECGKHHAVNIRYIKTGIGVID